MRYLDLSEAEAHALALADNKLGELAEWDVDALLAELSGGTDLLDLGWSETELVELVDCGDEAGEPKKWADGTKPAGVTRINIVTVVVATTEVEAIEAAIELALEAEPSRGSALARICREWAGATR